ncbi:hypothetical protein L209DRAFT_747185 [Thermothelomyces heterothallicus CBS 203.75]
MKNEPSKMHRFSRRGPVTTTTTRPHRSQGGFFSSHRRAAPLTTITNSCEPLQVLSRGMMQAAGTRRMHGTDGRAVCRRRFFPSRKEFNQ